ncbi:metallophosphoesterase family protein [Chloroflexia bacterium SDU3-3]|nr:metallophosphoesterase family protein [Chloroflexia bacterium SDU3-3]
MKLAVLSDIHANLAALRAVADDIARWHPDAVVVAGDIVNRGPRSRECLAFVLERQRQDGWQVLRGNHEQYVIDIAANPAPAQDLTEAVRAHVRWTAAQLGDAGVLAAMPTIIRLEAPDGGEVRVVHASMLHDRANILVDTPDEVLRQQIAPPPPLFVCGHTHRPLIRSLDDTLVVNCGAVGMPFDGDARASYARMTWLGERWHAEIQRLPYDRERAAADFVDSGMLACGGVARIIFAEFRTATPMLATWKRTYNDAVLAGAITPEQSVEEFLRGR